MDILANPWIISLLAMGFMVSNIMALKYVAKLKVGQVKKAPKKTETEDTEKDQLSEEESENSVPLPSDIEEDKSEKKNEP
ncbi:DUF2897 family protein [uncultured Vibrio sp.]|uniref:DUF2897 family protein n=1 Tax=uncultured Vibrio sp. TaxID=114054 RepID=UPI000915DC9D|nr:DUF2897 family protein [uncultured Vibrio sp.]OIQ25559.1 MAG: hypothetical protein BM561_05670 [Vibrio sp. MedPE-SWchi]